MWDKITPIERNILMGIVMGNKSDLTCQMLNIDDRAYDRHRSKLIKKMGCQTDVDLVWKALKLGWVKFAMQGLLTQGPVWVGGNRMILEQAAGAPPKHGGMQVIE